MAWELDGPAAWVVLAGQTGGDEKGEYRRLGGPGRGRLRRIVKLLAEAGATPSTSSA